MKLYLSCLSVGIFLKIVLEPVVAITSMEISETTAANCSYSVKMCDVASAKPGCPPCYNCVCIPILDPAIQRKSIYSKYLPRIRGVVNTTQIEPKVTPKPDPTVGVTNYAYDDYQRALAKENLRGSRYKRTDDEKCSYSFQKCHPNNTMTGCSKCHKCVCHAIRELAVNDTSVDEDPFVAFILPRKNVGIPQEEDNRVLGLEFPRVRDLDDFKVFIKLLLESGHASAVPFVKLMKRLAKSNVDHGNYEDPNYYHPFPDTSDSIIRTKDHVYNLADVMPHENQAQDDYVGPSKKYPQGRYQLYDRGFRLIRPILDIVDRRNKMVGDGRQLANGTAQGRKNDGVKNGSLRSKKRRITKGGGLE